MGNFIDTYQTLIGSFLAIIFSIGFWYFKSYVDEHHQREKNRKEIETIFWMAVRESEEAYKNVRYYVTQTIEQLAKTTKEIHVFIPQRFSRIYVSEERLAILKANLDFPISQQIDIAVSAVKVFNGYLDGIERAPQMIFESTLRMLETGLITKDQAINEFREDTDRDLNSVQHVLAQGLLISQRQLLRPLAAVAHRKDKNFWKMPLDMIDQILDGEADTLLSAVKFDSE